ncbi:MULTISPECIES: FHA domain-containing protein [unclassified Microbacterium]|uniref:FHA domain-containing protein n=1 Tax=unclassified Microbacterium TaxID=2609290 RepID=UPI00214C7739|nr:MULTISPECIES: FHA domain-containing protein [unclassified Microbacterium]MCR2784276.1 FHA domain-containing protein [Microbacterium sp. zg.B96]WIM14895.1 FHA domain-containing protein [Microbacterium sp. zg-B96]
MFTYNVPSQTGTAGFAMVADRFLLVVAAGVGDVFALELWNTLSNGDAALEDALSALARRGIERLPDFALVELVDSRTSSVSVAVRGSATAQLHGQESTTLAGAGVGTWVEGSAQRVAGIALTLAGSPTGSLLPLGRGVVRADRLQWGTVPAGGSHPAPAAPPARELPAWAADLDDPHSTMAVDRESLAELVAGALDDHTQLGAVRRRGPRPITRRFVVSLEGGRVLELDLPVVLGRAPEPAAHPGARLASLPSPRREVSGTHVELRLDGEQLLVRDLGSTNGTVVRHADGSAMLLRGGATARLTEGALLDIGDGNVARFHAAE